jgi:uncharacterized protein YcfJ
MLCVAALVAATGASAQVTFYEAEGFRGNAFMVRQTTGNLSPLGFNDRASSAIVERGRWQLCEDAGFRGRCIVLQPGNYPSLAQFDMSNRVSSARPVGNAEYSQLVAPAPAPAPAYPYRWRPDEKLFEVPVSHVRAVVGPPEQRCWVERQQVVEPSQPNVPGAIIGGILGGVLGHQIGGGRGRDVATVAGAVGGVAIGSNVNRSPGGAVYDQDVQRCAAVPGSAKPEYWDVTYYFGGVEHHVQMTTPPGPTVWVNGRGEPRG